MPPSERPSDRRARIREGHHRAIIDAAASLLGAKGADGFTVEELARRAEVSRRTVFNHFGSVDDIVITVCTEVLGDLVETFESRPSAPAGTSDAGVFDELAEALRSTDLVAPIAYLTRVLGTSDNDSSQRRAVVLLRAFTEVSERVAAEMLRRHPEADELTTRLLVSSLIGGLVVLHTHWLAATGGSADTASRAVWDELLDQLIRQTRDGYASTASLGAHTS